MSAEDRKKARMQLELAITDLNLDSRRSDIRVAIAEAFISLDRAESYRERTESKAMR